MSCPSTDSSVVDVAEVARHRPNVDLDGVREIREMIRTLRTLRTLGVRDRGYTLAPPYRSIMYRVSPYRVVDEEADAVHPWRCRR